MGPIWSLIFSPKGWTWIVRDSFKVVKEKDIIQQESQEIIILTITFTVLLYFFWIHGPTSSHHLHKSHVGPPNSHYTCPSSVLCSSLCTVSDLANILIPHIIYLCYVIFWNLPSYLHILHVPMNAVMLEVCTSPCLAGSTISPKSRFPDTPEFPIQTIYICFI